MVVTLIGKGVLYKTKLPQVAMGNYWITDENDKKLVSIEGNREGWKIISGNNMKIIRPKSLISQNISKIARSDENVIGEMTLKEYGMYYIYLSDYPNSIFILCCSPVYDESFVHLKVKTTQEILIGRGTNCHIIYDNPLVKQKQARIFFSNGKLMLENFDEDYGSFVNSNSSNKRLKMLFNGDVIFIMGLKIIILGRSIYINNPAKRVTFSKDIFAVEETEMKMPEMVPEDDTDIELYTEKDFFARAPRITNIIEREKIRIDRPPQSENREEMPLLYVLGSSLSMGMIMIISMISTTDRLVSGTATFKSTMFSVITSLLMLISILLIPILTRKWEKNRKIRNEQKRQTRYREYINSKIEYIDEVMKKQKEILYENFVSAEECAQIVVHDGSRLWERRREDEDFLSVRVGTGDLPLDADIEYPETEFTMDDDDLVEILNTIVNKSKIIKNVPITISLTEKNIAALIVKDNDRIVEKFTQNMIMQLITLQSYEDLKLVFLLKEDKSNRWEHLKTLPHIWDNTKNVRFWAEDYNDMREISSYLETEFNNRLAYDDFDYKSFAPYYLIITDDYKKIENLSIVKQILNARKNIGFGIFCITNNLLNLPNECKAFINLEDNKGEMFENEISSKNKKEFLFDSSYTFFFEKIGKKLSSIPIKYEKTNEASLPDSYTFLEMYDAGRVEQLNILERWKNNNSTNTLQAPVGIDGSGMPIVLDVHEKFHGPHGLIAGSTGSGKSEFIKTYILSLTVNYHPNDVTIILIDYKGGDLAGAFQNNNVKLPHLVGTITNIDTAGLQRSLASIQSELRRRQILFNEARNKIDEGNIDIYKYQKLYHEGILDEPIPHLLIICDEFAELKQQQQEFMDELISVARIGRSLGVHLILATQKPAGIVNDQIRSNSKFGICLRVQDRGDSVDVIRRPDAAELKKTGQFYMQVGNNEYFTLGLVAWSGAPYIPSDIIRKNVDGSIKFVSDIGTIIKEVGKPKKQVAKNKGEQLTSIVKYMGELAKMENIKTKPLWLENIPEIIFINALRKKYKVKKRENVISPVIGEFDDPYNQRQGVVELNLSTNGNTVIYGNAESGKETLLSTIVYDMMTAYTADEVELYILDFGSEALKIFKGSPIVGDIVFVNDSEKLGRLFDMLQQEIKNRTAILSDYGGDFDLYVNTSGNKMPMLVVIVNNYEVFSENYEVVYDDTLLTLSREGPKYGITFIITASSYNGLKYRLTQNFREKIALQLNNQDDYFNIYEKVGKKRPANIFGRGLVKLDDIYEFQTARICEAGEWNSYIRQTIKELRSNTKNYAKPIPVLPNKVTLEDVKEQLKDLTRVPIGIGKDSLEIFSYNFKRDFINIITGKNIDLVAQFTSHILEEINQLEDVSVIFIDAERIIQTGKISLNIEFQKMVLGMNIKQNEQKNVVCVIIGLDKFINDIEGTDKSFLEMLQRAKEKRNYNFIIVDSFTKLKSHEYDLWYKNYITKDAGIWVGNGVTDQYLISTNINDRRLSNRCGDSFGHAIRRERATLVKLLGMKEEGDEDG